MILSRDMLFTFYSWFLELSSWLSHPWSSSGWLQDPLPKESFWWLQGSEVSSVVLRSSTQSSVPTKGTRAVIPSFIAGITTRVRAIVCTRLFLMAIIHVRMYRIYVCIRISLPIIADDQTSFSFSNHHQATKNHQKPRLVNDSPTIHGYYYYWSTNYYYHY